MTSNWIWDALRDLETELVMSTLIPADWDWNQVHDHHGTPLMAVVAEAIRIGKVKDVKESHWKLIRYCLAQGADPRVAVRTIPGKVGPWGGSDTFPKLEAIHLAGHSALSLVFAIRRACNKHDGPYEKQITNANMVLKILAEFQASGADLSVPEATVDTWETVLRDKEAADVKISVVEKQSPQDEVFVSVAGTVYAHSLVLKAVSPVLKALLTCPMREGSTGAIQVEGVGLASVQLLLQLLYTGTTAEEDHDAHVLLGTLDLAHRWQAAHVVDIVEGALVRKVHLENLGVLCETAVLKNLPNLRTACKRFAQSSSEAANVSKILQGKDFPQCARDELSAPKPLPKRRRRHP